MRYVWVAVMLGAVLVSSGAGATSVFWASDPIAPGETVLVTGSGFGDKPGIEVQRLADGNAGKPGETPFAWSGAGLASEALQPKDNAVKFVLPAGLAQGVFAYRITGRDGAAKGLLNRPVAWWAQGDLGVNASPGGWVRVMGKNLGWKGAKGAQQAADEMAPLTTALLNGPKEIKLLAEADCYCAKLALPKDLPAGEYKVRVHNGCGGEAGWSEAVSISVEQPKPWPATVFNVRDCGAAGDGNTDDTEAVKAALTQAGAKGGGVVYFPRGRYLVKEALNIPRFTVLRGEKQELVNVLWPDMPAPPPALLVGKNSFGLEDITFYCSNYITFLTSDTRGPDAGDVFLRRLRVRADVYRGHMTPEEVDKRYRVGLKVGFGGGFWLAVLGGRNLEITDCDLYSSSCPLSITQPRGARIERNILGSGRWGGSGVFGGDGVIIADNQYIGCDLMSWGAAGGLGYGNLSHVYLARNTFALEHGGDREAITSDASGELYHGPAASAEGTTLMLPEALKPVGEGWIGAAVYVIGGKGAGQWRRGVRFEGAKVTVDRPWDVAPDATSQLTIVWRLDHWLLLDNEFSDVGVCVQLYGAAIEHICAGNISSRSAGFHNFGMNYNGIQPSWYIQWLGNEIREGNSYNSGHDNYMLSGDAHLGIFALPPSAEFGEALTYGCVARGNRLLNNAQLAVGGSDPYNPVLWKPIVQEVVVENNEISDADVGIFLRKASSGVLLRGNKFVRVKEEVRDEIAMLKAEEERRAKLLADPGPIAAWSFDNMRGSVVPDTTGHGFNLTITGKVEPAEGHKGKGAAFSGESFLRCEESAMFNLPNVTLALWIKPDTIKGRHGLIAKRFAGTAAPYVLSLWDGAIDFEANDIQGKWSFNFPSPRAIKEKEWNHVAAVVERGKGVRIYVNGAAIAHKDNPLDRTMNSEPLIIGREAWAGVNMVHEPCYYAGVMDEVKVWGRALSAEEVRAEFEAK